MLALGAAEAAYAGLFRSAVAADYTGGLVEGAGSLMEDEVGELGEWETVVARKVLKKYGVM